MDANVFIILACAALAIIIAAMTGLLGTKWRIRLYFAVTTIIIVSAVMVDIMRPAKKNTFRL